METNKIYIITQDFFPIEGGITTWVHNLALSLLEFGFDIQIITRHWNGRDYDDNEYPFSVHRLPDRRWKNYKYMRIYRLLCKQRKRNARTAVICANWKMGIPVRWFNILHPRRRLPFIIKVHGLDAFEGRKFNRKLMHKTLESADFVVTGAKNIRTIIQKEHNYRKSIPVISCGVDINVFKPMQIPRDIYDKYNIPQNGKLILSIGRLIERKGFDTVIKALPDVMAEYDNFTYLIGGRGKYEVELKRIARELNVSDHVRFLGYIPDEDVVILYNACDVFVMPSREIGSDIEGFGITYLEANACGKPVIGGDSGGVPEAVENEVNGLLVPPQDTAALAHAILKLLKDGELARKIGKNGLQRIHDKFLWSMTAKKYVELIKKIDQANSISQSNYVIAR